MDMQFLEETKSEFHKERIMVKEVKWTKYLWLSLLSFGGFMLELLSDYSGSSTREALQTA